MLSAVFLGTTLLYGAVIDDFESDRFGTVPKGWSIGVTNAKSDPVWEVVKSSGAPSGSHVLQMVQPAVKGGIFGIGSVFNLCYERDFSAKDLKAGVKFKSLTGEEDRGGGIVWRMRDENNYYVARFNPLEDNFRFYYVKDGYRFKIAGVKLRLEPGVWHSMTIIQKGNRFEGYIDGKRVLSAEDDHIKEAGRVGLWTKADAVTMFDDFTAESLDGR